MKPEQVTTTPARTILSQTRSTLIKTDPYASRTHRRIDVILLVVTIVILFLVLHASAHGQTVTLNSEIPRHGGDAIQQDPPGRGHHKKKPPTPPAGVGGDPVYTAFNTGNDNWSSSSHWSSTPTSGSATQLTYNGGSPYTNINNKNTDDIGTNAAFQLNILDLSGSGASSGTGSSITIAAAGANFLDFVSNGATTPQVNLTGNAGNGMTYTVSAPVKLDNNTLFTGDGTATFNFSGNVSGTGSLTKSGTSTLILSGTNSYTGATIISAGTLQLGNGGTSSLSSSSTITDNGNFTINQNVTALQGNTFSGSAISGSGSFTQAGTGTTIFTAANSYAGVTTISAGTLQLGNAGATGAITGTSSIVDNGNLTINRSNSFTQATDLNGAVISGTGSFTQLGSGTTTLTATNTYSGATTITSGTLQLGNGGTTGSITGTSSIADNANLTINRSNAFTQATDLSNVVISGTGSFTQAGNGTTTLSLANTYSGATTISAGTLMIDSAGSTSARLSGTNTITVSSGGTLLLANSSGTASNDRIKNSAAMTLDGGTFNTGGLSEHGGNNNTPGIGALTLKSSSIIDMGNGSSVIAFADSHAVAWTVGATLKIYDWTGTQGQGGGTDQLYFNNNNMGLTASQLGDIIFYSDAGVTQIGSGAEILNTGEVVPIPEPSTWIIGALTVVALGYTQRSRFRRLVVS